MASDSDKKLAVITGGAGGMGNASARRLASAGYALLLCDLRAEPLEAAAAALREQGASVETLAGDIADPAFPSTLLKAMGDRPLGALVHTAGLSPTMGGPERILAVNLDASVALVEALLPRATNGSVAVLFASVAGHMSLGAEADAAFNAPLGSDGARSLLRFAETSADAYTLSKRGVLRLVERQATAWGRRGARIVSISPGLIDTSMGQAELAAEPAAIGGMVAMTPLGRMGTADEIANAVAFLCSPAASYISGIDLKVDGGTMAAITSA
jgi:NAD(P)-dependent dehydrogenase (short-subunit alcohol dehydrogenase family)